MSTPAPKAVQTGAQLEASQAVSTKRDLRIDALRFIGLALIILAHVYPDTLVFNLRNFDVPLMVLVSGMSFALSYRLEAYGTYVWKRIKRLLVPVWLFLSGYFLYRAVLSPSAADFDRALIIPHFLLQHGNGVGYVWIIRVFLLVALVAPFIYKLHKSVASDKRFFLIVGLAFAAYELLRYFTRPYLYSGVSGDIADYLYYLIPYALLFAIGLRFPSLNAAGRWCLFLCGFIIFVVVGGLLSFQAGEYVATQAYKYPPSFYYFSYALWVCCLLWPLLPNLLTLIERCKLRPLLIFVASNSIWIYLWHICYLFLPVYEFNTFVRWALVFSLSTCTMLIQYALVQKLIAMSSNKTYRHYLRVLFTG
ncbi:acyltransferase family protein [Agaribacterium sp. ZY112]|uniref:acyltransferase family protein n=1 Tax=Agaribacterium sp. ZY112 TaxID=3233574 RepID=UPI003524293F